jgi:hypothetical protein
LIFVISAVGDERRERLSLVVDRKFSEKISRISVGRKVVSEKVAWQVTCKALEKCKRKLQTQPDHSPERRNRR